MKAKPDEAVVEVRAARAALCARFGNNPSRLLAYLRKEQARYHGRVIQSWVQLEPAETLREMNPAKKSKDN